MNPQEISLYAPEANTWWGGEFTPLAGMDAEQRQAALDTLIAAIEARVRA